ncbi:hypothetical protein RHSIM_Rhsim08G0003600 [Rhododendron simsii]|uniref:Dicer-like 3 n=1 Tax=Rhododendron simsii TaxID=118357 RepID=A0A834GGK3_RHOSS|nr:hypothetical protein RHSIM_Rhsim08G0003600 [Rhododendron simsii]
MHSTAAVAAVNPLKRSFEVMNSKPHSTDTDNFRPREYQTKVFQIAMRRNTIAVLDTGAGKTMIAVMIIKDIAPSLDPSPSQKKKLIVFLAPTVHLQFEVIRFHTHLKVEKYYGAKGVDDWNAECWEKEVNEHDVLVMTPQILLDALRKAFLSLDMVCLMIVDECHRATGNHPYAKIMQEFYHKSGNKPKIFGMTASPVIRKGVSSITDCEEQISELEGILDSQVYTIDDRTELEEIIPSAKETCIFYDPAVSFNMELKEKLESLWKKFDALLLDLQGSMPSQYRDTQDKYKALRKRLANDHAKFLYCLDDLGLLCTHEAVKVCIENAPSVTEECEFYRKSSLQYNNFLEEVLAAVGTSLPHGNEILWDIGSHCSNTVAMGCISPKFHELLRLFQSFGEARQVLCLIFVERIIAAKVVERVIKRIKSLSHFTVSYLTGSNSSVDAVAPKVQQETLASFRSGKVNLLFSTDVVEEGIHVPNCSSVIRFDLPKTVRSYIQSRGRARQNDSQFVLMLERGNIKQRDQIFDIIRSEYSMTDTAANRDPDSCVLRACKIKEIDAYYVDATGASVTQDSSVNLIHRYCEKLPRDKYFTPKPIFQFLLSGDAYQCKLSLPPSAAFQILVGPLSSNSHLSKQLVCFDACKKLHQMGALSDHLLPISDEPSESEATLKSRESASGAGAGTTKRKELHGTTCVQALSGAWGVKHEGATFQAYKIDFSCNKPEEQFSSFILLMESRLDDDVGNIEVELYLVSKFVRSSVTSCGEVKLDAEQVMKARCFHELFFNGLFGKLFVGSRSSGGGRKFLLQSEGESLWDPSNMYLLLPVESSNGCSHDVWKINWMGINSCFSVVEYMKENAWLSAKQSDVDMGDSLVDGTNSTENDYKSTNLIHLANKSVDLKNIRQTVVLAIHTGRVYSVLDVVNNTSAESPFDGNTDANSSSYSSFAVYFHKKYGITLMHPGQPLLLLKQSHNAHNLLVDFRSEGGACGKRFEAGNKPVVRKPQTHVHMPPELLVSIEVPISVIKSLYLLPSVMHRVESLMLASQLREEISFQSDFWISSSLILEAISTLRCSESFSMERLELLGDSVLKYAVSCHLFLKYPEKHEGQLSSQRSLAVCNATLYKVGIDRNLQGYIRDGAFDPRRWVAPGQRSLRPYPCSCGVDSSEVPLDSKFQTEDTKVVVGKCCDRGHRWMGSKTISDCVEALIGAYYVGGGLTAALYLMKWLSIGSELEPSLVDEAITNASLHSYIPKAKEIEILESKLAYEFSTKGLLLEAITHASQQELEVGFCYQRLEFLGDSVLDILITWHLYQSHTEIDPGELTDLRSASVNNENFAHVAVRRNLHPHLQHSSGFLSDQIKDYVKSVDDSHVKSVDDSHSITKPFQSVNGPKALGDMVESIAGAILIDTKLNLDEVWRIFKPILSPIVTPDKLELPPLRELIELCDSLGYFIRETCIKKGEQSHAELRLQLEDVLLVGEGFGPNRKAAKGQAAFHLLKDLEGRGISSSKRRKQGPDPVGVLSTLDLGKDICSQTDVESSKPVAHKKQKTKINGLHSEKTRTSQSNDHSTKSSGSIPVLSSINMKKGGPRTSLFELCKRLQWPMPTFKSAEDKSRTPIEFCEGSEKRIGFSSFTSTITLTIPDFGVIELSGDPRADKKSSFDSAAVLMLYELEQQQLLVIGGGEG